MKPNKPLILFLLLFCSQPLFANTVDDVQGLLSQKEFKVALSLVNKALNKGENSERLLLQKGYILINLQRLDEAVVYYQDLIKRLPESPEPMNNLGAIYQLQKQYDKAIEQLNMTIERFPSFAAAYENLADTHIHLATQNYQKGAQINPEYRSLITKAKISQQFHRIVQQTISTTLADNKAVPQSGTGNQGNASGGDTDTASNEKPSPSNSTDTASDDLGGGKLAEDREVGEFISSWVKAWSSKDIDAYFAYYDESFTPEKNLSIDSWKARKRAVIQAAQQINISVKDILLENSTPQTLVVSLTQDYASDRYQKVSRKELTLKRTTRGFKILAER